MAILGNLPQFSGEFSSFSPQKKKKKNSSPNFSALFEGRVTTSSVYYWHAGNFNYHVQKCRQLMRNLTEYIVWGRSPVLLLHYPKNEGKKNDFFNTPS